MTTTTACHGTCTVSSLLSEAWPSTEGSEREGTGGREDWAGSQAALPAAHEPGQVLALPAAQMNKASSAGGAAVGVREQECVEPAGGCQVPPRGDAPKM